MGLGLAGWSCFEARGPSRDGRSRAQPVDASPGAAHGPQAPGERARDLRVGTDADVRLEAVHLRWRAAVLLLQIGRAHV